MGTPVKDLALNILREHYCEKTPVLRVQQELYKKHDKSYSHSYPWQTESGFLVKETMFGGGKE